MNHAGLLLLLTALLAGPAYGQAPNSPTPSTKPKISPTPGTQASATPAATTLACGVLKAETSRTGATSNWTISSPAGKTTETGVLKNGPRFECLDGAILVVEFTSSAGHSFFDAYFADGTNIGYGRQQIDRRGGRFVLPIQAKARIAQPLRAAFDYHCRLDMPADPIPPTARADCLF
ncbi:MAG: hypothetical protein PSV46_26770 [Reyranella sp.]|nr:hypothetical protein [Reyranella sp.]